MQHFSSAPKSVLHLVVVSTAQTTDTVQKRKKKKVDIERSFITLDVRLIQSKAPEQLLNRLCGEIVLLTTIIRF